MKKFNFKRIAALALGLSLMVSTLIPGVSAANEAEAIVDSSKPASLTLYKYDTTTAESDGAWDVGSYVSTGIYDSSVNSALNKYALQGVEFSFVKLARLAIYKGASKNGHQEVIPLYGFTENTRTGSKETIDFLSALGLTTNDAYRTDHDSNQNRVWYFESDTLINALATSLNGNSTVTKTALEQYMRENNGIALPETDGNGKTGASNLEQGLYLVIETRVPENVTSTTDPFLVSLPMTTIDGSGWNYDVTV
ncbi:MAG: pilin N-terminal domain-containing protein [Oscillospiraceae bacterium]|nr:pilin N-terminal domain-containing protein [Oscillospiraceae bacterium]